MRRATYAIYFSDRMTNPRPFPAHHLTTERLVLSTPTRDDAPDIARHLNDLDVSRNLAIVPFPYTIEDAHFFVSQIAPNACIWKVAQRENAAQSATFVGVIGLHCRDDDAQAATASLGYWFAKPHWGRGFATEAARAAVTSAWAHGLDHLSAGYFEDNPASANVLRKVGFVEGARTHEHCLALGMEKPHMGMHLKRPHP